MTQIRYLCDECTDPDMIAALLRREPSVDIIRVGWHGAPASGTLDPDLLIEANAVGRFLVSNDKSTLPSHLAAHYAKGLHTHGLGLLRAGYSIGRFADELLLLWVASEAEEWIDGMTYIPL